MTPWLRGCADTAAQQVTMDIDRRHRKREWKVACANDAVRSEQKQVAQRMYTVLKTGSGLQG